MISVIVPVYNAEKYLRRCVDSILASTCSDFEIVLVNDGSTDGSPQICQEYASQDMRITVVHQENQGVSAARNKGIDSCQGEWVIFVDADDFITSDFLGLVARTDYQNMDLLQFDFVRQPHFPTDSQQTGSDTGKAALSSGAPCKTLSFQGDQIQQLIRGILIPGQLLPGGNTDFRSPCLKAYKKAILDQYGIRFSPRLMVGEDLLFNLEYHLKATSCVYIPRPVYHYDVHEGSATHGFRTGLMQNHARLQEAVRNVLMENHLFSLYQEDFYSYCLENLTFVLIREVFHPHSNRTYSENRALCHTLRQNAFYTQAMKYNFRCGILPRKVLVLCFQMRLYLATCMISRISFHYLERKNASCSKADTIFPSPSRS